MMAAPRRRKMIGHRRRVEDEGEEEEGAPDHFDLDDDSLTDGSLASDDHDPAEDSDTSNIDEASPTAAGTKKASTRASNGHPNGKSRKTTKTAKHAQAAVTSVTDVTPEEPAVAETQEEQVQVVEPEAVGDTSPAGPNPAAPLVVSSSAAAADAPQDRRRREHDEYRRKRDEDPAFVPNRGAFFMHDHRHAGPSANGFRPFGRGRGGRGRGGGGIGGPFAPYSHHNHDPADPTTNGPWAHDMHEAVTEPTHFRHGPRATFQGNQSNAGPEQRNGDSFIPTCPPSASPINRTLSTEKYVGNVQVRVHIPSISEPMTFSMPSKQYTKLPDHRPPLRRDKAVRISLPDLPPRFVMPALDRSFVFIPRALRPNQQRLRGGAKHRSGLGSIGGFSRRTSIFGGSYYNGSTYSPSVALSRRSSIAPDSGRDNYIVSPTGSTFSRPPLPNDRPVVRLPPRPEGPPVAAPFNHHVPAAQPAALDNSQPPMHGLPQEHVYREAGQPSIPMHQPRPQKAVSLEHIESPSMQQSYQQAFHHQVPVQVSNGLGHDQHSRNPSYSQHSTGTPLSLIPERAIHAAPFQPTQFAQPGYYPPYQVMQAPPPPPNYYYPPAPYSAGAPAFVPSSQQPQNQGDVSQANGQASSGSNLVAQEIGGTLYFFNASEIAPMSSYPPYTAPSQGYAGPGGVMGMNSMVTPSPDGFYYPQSNNGVVYYTH